jgi:undecaprenyl-diphosphatase
MTPFEAAVLGLIQGVTEFLPISSSAHLILTSRLLGWQDQGLHFDMAANSGSLLALVAYFRHDLRGLLSAWIESLSGFCSRLWPWSKQRSTAKLSGDARLVWILAVATVPVAIAGFLGQDLVARAARSTLLIAITSIFFGLLLWIADRRCPTSEPLDLTQIGLKVALIIGSAQVFALIPGSSRSGVTITAALLLGLARPAAARFSLLLAIPVGILVGGKDLADIAAGGVLWGELPALGIGFVVSAVSAYLVIGWLLRWVEQHDLTAFVIYRIALGLALIAILVQ